MARLSSRALIASIVLAFAVVIAGCNPRDGGASQPGGPAATPPAPAASQAPVAPGYDY